MNFRFLRLPPIILLTLLLAGCATPWRAQEVPALAPAEVAEETWWLVDSDIAAGALAATGPANELAHRCMARWRQRVDQQAASDFVPWFSSYWAQQWMTVKVAWYKLQAEEGGEPPVDRLAAYLQAQYYDRVLAPAAQEVDPDAVIAEATRLYVARLAAHLQALPGRYSLAPAQLTWRLHGIPAILPASPAAPGATLDQLVAAAGPESLPAYAALLRQVREDGGMAAAGLSNKRISPLARRVSEKMFERLAISGGTSAASALVGGVAGTIISIGAAGVGLALHEKDRGPIEAELRGILAEEMDELWRLLLDDRQNGVTAGIHRLAGQIEHSLQRTQVQPVVRNVPPAERPLAELPPAEAPETALAEVPEAPKE